MSELLQEIAIKYNGDFINVRTKSGYHLCCTDPNGANVFLHADASNFEIGSVSLDSLMLSRHMSLEQDESIFTDKYICQDYQNWKNTTKKKYNYKSISDIFRIMMIVSVEKYEDFFIIYPWERISKEGYQGLKEQSITIPSTSSPEEIGRAVRLVFSRCTGLGRKELNEKEKALGMTF